MREVVHARALLVPPQAHERLELLASPPPGRARRSLLRRALRRRRRLLLHAQNLSLVRQQRLLELGVLALELVRARGRALGARRGFLLAVGFAADEACLDAISADFGLSAAARDSEDDRVRWAVHALHKAALYLLTLDSVSVSASISSSISLRCSPISRSFARASSRLHATAILKYVL